ASCSPISSSWCKSSTAPNSWRRKPRAISSATRASPTARSIRCANIWAASKTTSCARSWCAPARCASSARAAANGGGCCRAWRSSSSARTWTGSRARARPVTRPQCKPGTMANDYRIRPMTREEVGLAIDWAAAEGWNPGLNDAPCFYAADPRGFLMGYWGEEPVASISVVKYGADFGFLGFYIVKPAFRGRGLGFALWQAGMASLAGRNVGLDGVVAQQDNYRESGFTLAWRNIRHEGVGGGRVPADPRIVPLAALPFETVRAYDRLFFPADRGTFLQCWIAQPGSTAIGFMAGDRLEGYGVL